jgi:hypothetical protein
LAAVFFFAGVTECAGNGVGRLPDLRSPSRIVAVGRGRNRQGGNDAPLVVVDWRCDALEADFRFLVVVGDAVAAHLVQFLFEGGEGGQGVRGLAGQAGALGVVANRLRRFHGQEELAERSQVQGRAAADQVDDADQRASRRRALDIDDVVVVTGPKVDRLADRFMEFLHERQRDLAQADARLDEVAQFEQTDPQAVSARILAFDELGCGHRGEDAMGGRRVQGGCRGQLLERRRFARCGQRIEQRHHALDDLD